jgi:ATP:ADP antiporter, AAA family
VAHVQITPIVLATTGLLFFGLVIFSEPLTPALASLGLTPLFAAVLVGAAQNVFSKGAKYSLFDPCKVHPRPLSPTPSAPPRVLPGELAQACPSRLLVVQEMAYIPLDEEVHTKGKAAIDVICNPVGKSGGATIQQVSPRSLLVLFCSVQLAIFAVKCPCWLASLAK